jgi:hypothetical protein
MEYEQTIDIPDDFDIDSLKGKDLDDFVLRQVDYGATPVYLHTTVDSVSMDETA